MHYVLVHVKAKFHIQYLDFVHDSFVSPLWYTWLVGIDLVTAQHGRAIFCKTRYLKFTQKKQIKLKIKEKIKHET